MTTKQKVLIIVVVALGLVAMACSCDLGNIAGGGGGGTISYGSTVSGNINFEDEEESWTFNGAAGDMVTISMTGSGSFDDTYLELYGPDGNEVAYDDDSGDGLSSLIYDFPLPQSGAYRIVARAFGSDTGPYTLTLTAR